MLNTEDLCLYPGFIAVDKRRKSTTTRTYLKAANEGYIHSNQDYDKMSQLLDNEFKGYTRTYYYPTSINPYSALRWGNVYSRFQHTQAIRRFTRMVIFLISVPTNSVCGKRRLPQISWRIYPTILLIIGEPFEGS